MSRIKSKGTQPEKKLYLLFKKAGFKIRRNAKELPGKPDILLERKKVAVFLHGCFWHRHRNCRFTYTPKSNIDFWTKKFAANKKRDAVVKRELKRLGYLVSVIWECQLSKKDFDVRKVISK